MTHERLVVRATLAFFEDLDRQLGPERGPNGEPSTNDFQAFELLEIVERFATGFFDLPPLLSGRGDYRVLVSAGVLVRGFSVVGHRAMDGAVDLMTLELDLGSDWV